MICACKRVIKKKRTKGKKERMGEQMNREGRKERGDGDGLKERENDRVDIHAREGEKKTKKGKRERESGGREGVKER